MNSTVLHDRDPKTENSSTDHRLQWQPPPRPDWVQRVNEEGRYMDLEGIVPLDERSLLDGAIRATGLSDFGTDDWREPFRIFIKSLDEEADLNLIGRLWARSEILYLLQARLQIEETYKRHPEIEDEEIVHPIFIIGYARAGTSFLQNTLGADPDNGVLMHWEQMFPCPPPEKASYRSDPRIEKADKLIGRWNRVVPTISSMHEFAATIPMEDSVMMAASFMAPGWLDCFGQVSSYDQYFFRQNLESAFRFHKRVLKLLQWKNPRQRWILKDPWDLARLEAVLKIYPDACFVWPHRDPVRSLASVVSLIGTVQWSRSDHPFKGVSLENMTNPDNVAQVFNAVIAQLEAGLVPARQIHHLHYHDLVADPIRTIEAMYRHFGIALSAGSRRAMARHLADHPRDARPPHRFDPGSPDAVRRAREAFRPYQEYFRIANE